MIVWNQLEKDKLINIMQEVSYKPDTLIDRTNIVYSELMNMNSKCDKMIASVEKMAYDNAVANQRIINNTGITAYNSERTRTEIKYQNRMNLINGRVF